MRDLGELLAASSHELLIRHVLTLRLAAKCAGKLSGCDLLLHVANFSAASLASCATPFVWQAAQRYLAETSREHAEALAVCCFDAYYSLLPAGVVLQIEKLALLPALGVVANGALGRPSDEAVGAPENTLQQSPQHILRVVSPNVTIISMPTSILFNAEENQYISPGGAEEFATLVADGFALIRWVNAYLYRDILHDVKWLVRVLSPSPDVHRSFTSASLDGVLFLSHVPTTKSNSAQIIAEAIVHEWAHLHVHRIMRVFPLHSLPENEKFYSPWRDDPRPVSGLLHGLYVLARLCEFYKAALQAPKFANDVGARGLFRQRLSWCQASAALGLLQVPAAMFTAEGMVIIGDIQRATQMDGSDPDNATVEMARAHVNRWRMQHSALASRLKLPHWL